MNFKHLACLAALLSTSMIVQGDIVYPEERADRDYNTTATEKLDRGFSNLILFWEEIPHAWWYNADRYDGAGFFKGTADGLRNAGVRFGQGMFDIATFPWNTGNFALPWDPPPPQVHPEWIPFVEWMLPGVTQTDHYHQDWIDGWESQRDP